MAAATIADADPSVVALACFTRSGRSARQLSALRPDVPILAFTPLPAVARGLALWRGVSAHVLPDPGDDSAIGPAVRAAISSGAAGWKVGRGQSVVLLAASDPGPGADRVEVLRG